MRTALPRGGGAILLWIAKGGALFSAAAFALSLVVAAIIMLLAGFDPLEGYHALLIGSFGSWDNFATALGTATPLCFAGLSVSIGKRAGFFNIGVEGQLLSGALTAAIAGAYAPGLPAILHVPLCFGAAWIVGGLIGVLSVKLKQFMKVSELIITVMLNYVVAYTVELLVAEFFLNSAYVVRTPDIAGAARLAALIPFSRLTTGVFFAIAGIALLWWIYEKTRFGYEITAIGLNRRAAETGGINVNRGVGLAMFISGGLAALGGAVETMGVHGYYVANMVNGYGYDGLTIAIMGGGNPIGCALASIIFGALRAGSSNMNRTTSIPGEFISILQALVILFVSTPLLIRYFQAKLKKRPPTTPATPATPTTPAEAV
ncbi:MAG: ABC transporter permease [Peptococcaceae bacterium]|jgi:simple sugar transport system permease protein|nr:ABC transporter permease [Peptococcaceae bacterium]